MVGDEYAGGDSPADTAVKQGIMKFQHVVLGSFHAISEVKPIRIRALDNKQ